MGYILVGKPYYVGVLRGQTAEEPMNYQLINTDRVYNVELSSGMRVVDGESRLTRRGFHPNTTVYFGRIQIDNLVLTKHSNEEAVIEEVKTDFQNILAVMSGDAKVANLSDFEVEEAAKEAAPAKEAAAPKEEPKQEAPAETPRRTQSTRSGSSGN